MVRASLLGRLLLENAERGEITVLGKDLFDPSDTERSDQLILEIGVADEEVVIFQITDGGGVPHTRRLESLLEETHLGQVAQSGKADVLSGRTVPPEEMPDIRRTVHRQDGDIFRL